MKGRETGSRDRGLTGLELLILVAIVAAAVAAGLYWEGHHGGPRAPSGIIPLSVQTAERAMVVAGETYGYWIQDGKAGEVPVGFTGEDRPGIDAISIPVQLLVGGSPLDMDSLKVVVRSRAGTTALPRDESGLPGRSSWAVAGKTGVLPFQDADRDDLLEEPETFQILVLPPGPLDPGDHVTVTLSPPLGIALVVDRDIPGHVTPVTLLSL
jgi:archaellin